MILSLVGFVILNPKCLKYIQAEDLQTTQNCWWNI